MDKLLKLLIYLLKKFTAIVIIVSLIAIATFIAYDSANIYIVLNEGMSQRAASQLSENNANSLVLSKFYTQEFLNNDPCVNDDVYDSYRISNYNFNIKIKKLWVWPWQNNVTVRLVEKVSGISGKPLNPDVNKEIPQWPNGNKNVLLKKINGEWKIDEIVFLSPIEEDTKDIEETDKTDSTDNTEDTQDEENVQDTENSNIEGTENADDSEDTQS